MHLQLRIATATICPTETEVCRIIIAIKPLNHMKNILVFLNEIHPLNISLQNHLSKVLKTRVIKRKAYLLRAGEINSVVCFIQSGLLRCFFEEGEKEVSRWFMREGDVVFSIASFYKQNPSKEFIQALEDTTVDYITYYELQEIYRLYPEFNLIARLLTEKYYQLWDEQLSSILLYNAKERYKWLCNYHPELVLRVPSKYIASYWESVNLH